MSKKQQPRAKRPARLQSQIRYRMIDRGIRSVSALKRELAGYGVEISNAQLGRLVDGKVEHVSIPVIAALVSLFGCGVGDLYAPA